MVTVPTSVKLLFRMSDPSVPVITTIIPTYKRPKFLRRAIVSALAQTGPSLQVCVYDNASGDETSAIVAEFAAKDSRVKYFCHEKNIGGMANFQYGLSHVITQFFSFLSDDDVLLPGFYETAVRDFEEFPEAAFWCGVTISMTSDGTFYTARVADWPRTGLFTPPEGVLQMIKGSMPCWTSVLFRRRVIDQVGPLNEQLQGPSDIEYLLRNASRNPFIVSKHPGALFLLHPESYSETSSLQRVWPGWQGMMKSVSKADGLSDKDRHAIEQGMRSNAQRMLYRRGAAALAKKDYEFSGEAAGILSEYFQNNFRSLILGGLTKACVKVSFLQALYSRAYRLAERTLVYKRFSLRRKYGHFSRYL
ncbi:MAG: glycosyltransferase family 2 protein [Gammaproteobacteria bacterium]